MIAKQSLDPGVGRVLIPEHCKHLLGLLGLIGVLALARNVQSPLPKHTFFNCFGSIYELLESVMMFGTPAQWTVALLGFYFYPALSRTGRTVDASGATTGTAPGASSFCRRAGPGSHSIQVEHAQDTMSQPGSTGQGFLKRLRRVLSEGRARARQLCGRPGSLPSAVSSFSRKRSFGSRSSKSEDVLSSRLSMDSMVRAAQHHTGGGSGSGGRRGLFPRLHKADSPSSAGAGGAGVLGSSRWQPSMSRIKSGQHLTDMAPSTSSVSSATAGKRLEILSYNGFQTVDCMSHELTDPAFAGVKEVVTDTHLLQFGSLIGEASAELALSQAGSTGPIGPAPASLFGAYDRPALYRQGWELIAEEHKPGLHYWNWRRHLRRGLYMYKSKTVYETATTAQIVGFTYDMEFRRTWDEAMAAQLPIPPPPSVPSLNSVASAAADASASASPSSRPSLAEAEAKSAGGRSAFMYARTKFPPPMANREYTYARRCWAKPDDGGCYCISRACAHPAPPAAGCRTVRVTDFVSGYVIRSSKGIFDSTSPAVEVVNVYFEDPCVPSGIVNMGIRRGLWPLVQKAEAAFRDYLLTRVHGNLEQPPPERPIALDSLGAAMPPLRAGRPAPGTADQAPAAADPDAASCVGTLPAAGPLLFAARRLVSLASPYVLVYRAYMATWRLGRATLLAALSSAMSVWCNTTGLAVAAAGLAREAAGAVRTSVLSVTAPFSAPSTTTGSFGACTFSYLLSAVLRPWEALVAALARRRPCDASGEAVPAGSPRMSAGSLSGSGSAGSSSQLLSHPLPTGGSSNSNKRSLRQRPSFAPVLDAEGSPTVTDGAGPQSPRGQSSQSHFRSRTTRVALARRCAVLAVKVARLAGAGLLLGRAARTGGTGTSGGGAGVATAASDTAGAAASQPPQSGGQVVAGLSVQPRRAVPPGARVFPTQR